MVHEIMNNKRMLEIPIFRPLIHFGINLFKSKYTALTGFSWAQLVRAPSWYTRVVGLTPGQATYKNQPMNA